MSERVRAGLSSSRPERCELPRSDGVNDEATRRGAAWLTAVARDGGSRRLHDMRRPSAAAVALVQGAFYVATGVWALVDLDSFMAVTGPKTDLWLV
jgi:hypothetical protein